MGSAEQPTDSNANQDGGVRLLFDRLAQEPLERTCRLRHGIRGAVGDVGGTGASLPVDILRSTSDLLGNAFRPLLRIVQRAVQIAATGSVLGHIKALRSFSTIIRLWNFRSISVLLSIVALRPKRASTPRRQAQPPRFRTIKARPHRTRRPLCGSVQVRQTDCGGKACVRREAA